MMQSLHNSIHENTGDVDTEDTAFRVIMYTAFAKINDDWGQGIERKSIQRLVSFWQFERLQDQSGRKVTFWKVLQY